MMVLLIQVSGWVICEAFASALLFATYRLFAWKVRSAADRFGFLRVAFALLLALPWFPDFAADGGRGQLAIFTPLIPTTHLSGPVVASGILTAIPALFAAAGGLYLVWLGWRLARLVNSLREARTICAGATPIASSSHWPVYLSESSAPGPMTLGFLRPRIVIPAALYPTLSPAELDLVLRHEGLHAARRDGLANLLRLLVREALAFSPFIHWLSIEYEQNMEISIDARIVGAEPAARKRYGELILRLADWQPKGAAIPFGNRISGNFVGTRLATLLRPIAPSRSRRVWAASLFFSVALSYGLGAVGLRPSAWAAEGDASSSFHYDLTAKSCSGGINCQGLGGGVYFQDDDASATCGTCDSVMRDARLLFLDLDVPRKPR